ncbi:UbiA prenyltransferase family-domain-containing protein [Podospora didyma]|uniref:UbiA prenyltransferase family-domain-containing protein n=1 Tax=Podospora didyma TaxID=330526 RepID=A0AAE0K4K2_9PEZI|nr:UbiA prenyltransferase family-domain-containing protein [Podospora didyma]
MWYFCVLCPDYVLELLAGKLMPRRLCDAKHMPSYQSPRLALIRSIKWLRYQTHTLWLFPQSNLKDSLLPSMTFAVSTTLAAPTFGLGHHPASSDLLHRLPLSVLWTWLALLVFCLQNQHNESSIIEDKINKPWRPIPAGRITIPQTNAVLAATYPIWLATSWYLGTLRPCLILTALTIYYNELGGSEHGGLARNVLNASGYSCFFAGALQTLLGPAHDVYGTPKAAAWLLMVCLVVCSTIHIQDFRDEAGDRLRGRKTLQTTLGDAGSRWAAVSAAFFWSVRIPVILGLGRGVLILCCLAAGVLAFHLLRCLLCGGVRTVQGDIVAYKAWCAWFVCILLSPLLDRVPPLLFPLLDTLAV